MAVCSSEASPDSDSSQKALGTKGRRTVRVVTSEISAGHDPLVPSRRGGKRKRSVDNAT